MHFSVNVTRFAHKPKGAGNPSASPVFSNGTPTEWNRLTYAFTLQNAPLFIHAQPHNAHLEESACQKTSTSEMKSSFSVLKYFAKRHTRPSIHHAWHGACAWDLFNGMDIFKTCLAERQYFLSHGRVVCTTSKRGLESFKYTHIWGTSTIALGKRVRSFLHVKPMVSDRSDIAHVDCNSTSFMSCCFTAPFVHTMTWRNH